MKTSRLFWGAFFVSLGLLLLADRYDLFTLGWEEVWRFWPLLLIFLGAAMLFRTSHFRTLAIVLGGLALALLVAAFLSFAWGGRDWETRRESRGESFTLPIGDSIKDASLVFQGGAGVLEVREDSSALLQATTHTDYGSYTYEVDSSDGAARIRVAFEGGRKGWRIGWLENDALLLLHPRPSWDLDFELGASRIDLDLTKLAVEHLHIKMGASRSTIRLGDLAPESEVEIEAGVSSLTIEVPEALGCRLRLDAPVSGKKIHGFTKVGDGEYETDNASTAEKRANIFLHAGVSSIRVNRL
jgi:hypothetical protein